MVKNRLLLGSVAFIVGFGLSLLMNRDMKTALLTGLITVPAAFSGIVAAEYKQRTQQKLAVTALQSQIYQLERWKTQLNQSLYAIAAEKQRTETNLNFLKIELSQLHTQIAEQRSYKQQLGQDLFTLTEQKSKLKTETHDLKNQIQACEKRRGELHQYLHSLKTEKQDTEVIFHSLKTELEQLQIQFTEQDIQQQISEISLANTKQSKNKLEEKLHTIQIHIQELKQQKENLNQSLTVMIKEKEVIEIDIRLFRAELNKLQAQVLEQQSTKDRLEQDLTLTTQKYQLEVEQKQVENLTNEWLKLGKKLTSFEFQVLKAILQQSEPNATIKKIAEENLTMPELLIDSINEHALDIIGDLIIEPGNSHSVPPKILEEYLTNVNNVLRINKVT